MAPTANAAQVTARQDGYSITLALAPLTELGVAPAPGAAGGFGYRLDVSGPDTVHVDLELNILRVRGCAWSHTTVARFDFQPEPGQAADTPLGRRAGSVKLTDGARPGDEGILLATTRLPSGWMTAVPPAVTFRLERDGSGGLVAVPAKPTLTLNSPDASPDASCAQPRPVTPIATFSTPPVTQPVLTPTAGRP